MCGGQKEHRGKLDTLTVVYSPLGLDEELVESVDFPDLNFTLFARVHGCVLLRGVRDYATYSRQQYAWRSRCLQQLSWSHIALSSQHTRHRERGHRDPCF